MGKMLYQNRMMERKNIIDVEDRGYQFGDGIYEVIGVYEGEPFMLDEHMERLERSAREIKLKLPYPAHEIKSRLIDLVHANKTNEGIIYMQVSRGISSREHYFPAPEVSSVLVAYTREEERLTELENSGAIAVLTEDIRWMRCDIKTLNLLPNALAKQEAVEKEAIEAIMHRDKTVTEGSSSNVFMVRDGELFTHPANNYILNGITRRKILQICEKAGIKVNEQTFTVDELLAADEVFISATKLDIIPILRIGNNVIGTGLPGELTHRILHAFRIVIGELSHQRG